MNCMLCGGNIEIVRDNYIFDSKAIGLVSVPNIEYEVCSQCGERLVSSKEGTKILNFVMEREDEALRSLPVDDFITAEQAAEVLEVTKQAFSKNKKIKRGLIFNVTIGNRKLYLKKSVELFKENNNNGIFRIIDEQDYERELVTRDPKVIIVYKILDIEENQIDLSGYNYADIIEVGNTATFN